MFINLGAIVKPVYKKVVGAGKRAIGIIIVESVLDSVRNKLENIDENIEKSLYRRYDMLKKAGELPDDFQYGEDSLYSSKPKETMRTMFRKGVFSGE